MVSWVIILIALIALFVISKFIHFRNLKHKVSAIIVILLLLFLISTFTGVVKDNSINLKTPSGVFEAGKLYFVWLGQAFDNIGAITGNAVKMDWSVSNKTH